MSLPEIIPPGTFVLVPADERTTGLRITKRRPEYGGAWFVNATGADLSEAQALHLLDTPDRPHDVRIDGSQWWCQAHEVGMPAVACSLRRPHGEPCGWRMTPSAPLPPAQPTRGDAA